MEDNNEIKKVIEEFEYILKLARKGTDYDETRRNLYSEIDKIKNESKQKINELYKKLWRMQEENNLLKSTHQDWIAEMCTDCMGAGGFDDGQGGGEPCHCDCGTIYNYKHGDICYCPKCGEIMEKQFKDNTAIVSCCDRNYTLVFAQVRFHNKPENIKKED